MKSQLGLFTLEMPWSKFWLGFLHVDISWFDFRLVYLQIEKPIFASQLAIITLIKKWSKNQLWHAVCYETNFGFNTIITNYELRITIFGKSITNYELRITVFGLLVCFEDDLYPLFRNVFCPNYIFNCIIFRNKSGF